MVNNVDTQTLLERYVDYRGHSNPKEYNEIESGDDKDSYQVFRNTMDAHLKGGFRPDGDKGARLYYSASCPSSLRDLILAQHDFRAKENRLGLQKLPPNDEPIRVMNLFAGTFGFSFTLLTRIIRVAIRTLLLPFTALYAYGQQNRYGVKGWAKEDIKRVAWEWIDLKNTIVYSNPIVGLVNMLFPNAIKLDSVRDYYVDRHDRTMERNEEFRVAKEHYQENQAIVRENMRANKNKFAEPGGDQDPDNGVVPE